MSNDRIEFRGRRVLPDWPERLRQAQRQTTCHPNGVEMRRVRYGEEVEDWGANEGPCRDCSATKGEYHVPGCDRERCPSCGGQIAFGCECEWPWKVPHETWAKIRAVLNTEWDPIGVAEIVEDEYESYVNSIYVLLSDGSDDPKIAGHLHKLETTWMGLRGSSTEHRLHVVAALRLLQVSG